MVKNPRKKRDIDLSKIKWLYIKSYEELSNEYLKKTYLSKIWNPLTLDKISMVKQKFDQLRDKYEFNDYNEEFFKSKTSKILDFEEKLRKDFKEISKNLEIINKAVGELDKNIRLKMQENFSLIAKDDKEL